LDVDDVYTYDYSGTGSRLVCVAYVEHNATHLLNVNKALLDGDYAVISNFENEFNPYLWSLYSLNPIAEPTPTPSPTATPKASPTPSPTPIPSLTPLPTASTVPILIPRLLYAGIATLIALAVIVFLYFYVKRNK
jgi:hypothetical protein